MSYWMVTARGPQGAAGYIAEAANSEEAMAIVNDHLPPRWGAAWATMLPPNTEMEDLFKTSAMILRATA